MISVISFLTHFIFKRPGHHAESSKNNLTATNTDDVLSAKQCSSGLPQEQSSLPARAKLSSRPHPYYGYIQRSPRMRNFNPVAPPNVTIGPHGFHRVIVPEQRNWFLSYSPLDSPNFSPPLLQVTFFVCYSQR